MNNMTNVNFTTRKLRKPLMERKRRARINRSLDELYDLLTESEFATKGSKLEKADILEMTVQYLRQLKRRECSQESKENLENVLLERYLSGFEKCAEEIERIVDPQIRQKVGRHLKNSLERVKTQQRNVRLGTGETEGVENTRKQCSVLIQEPKELKILPSKLPNGDVLLLLSSSAVKCEERLVKSDVWRPWW